MAFIINGTKNVKIMGYLKDDKNITEDKLPTATQLINFRYYYRNKVINQVPVKDKAHFTKGIQDNSFEASKSKDLFVLDYVLKQDQFIFVMSSLNLLNNAIDLSNFMPGNLCIDATYKLITCKFPLIVMGVEDKCHNLHTIAFDIVSKEDTQTYTFVLATVKNLLKEKFNFNWKIKVISS